MSKNVVVLGTNVKQFQIGYVGNYGHGTAETMVMLKEDIAKVMGFGSWKEMIEKWPRNLLHDVKHISN